RLELTDVEAGVLITDVIQPDDVLPCSHRQSWTLRGAPVAKGAVSGHDVRRVVPDFELHDHFDFSALVVVQIEQRVFARELLILLAMTGLLSLASRRQG